MSQKLTHVYRDTLSSEDLNHKFGALLPAGVYSGFTVATPAAGIVTLTPGFLLMPCGVMVEETVSPTMPNYGANTSAVERFDYIVCHYDYEKTLSHASAEYKILEGQAAYNDWMTADDGAHANDTVLLGVAHLEGNADKWDCILQAPLPWAAASQQVHVNANNRDAFSADQFGTLGDYSLGPDAQTMFEALGRARNQFAKDHDLASGKHTVLRKTLPAYASYSLLWEVDMPDVTATASGVTTTTKYPKLRAYLANFTATGDGKASQRGPRELLFTVNAYYSHAFELIVGLDKDHFSQYLSTYTQGQFLVTDSILNQLMSSSAAATSTATTTTLNFTKKSFVEAKQATVATLPGVGPVSPSATLVNPTTTIGQWFGGTRAVDSPFVNAGVGLWNCDVADQDSYLYCWGAGGLSLLSRSSGTATTWTDWDDAGTLSALSLAVTNASTNTLTATGNATIGGRLSATGTATFGGTVSVGSEKAPTSVTLNGRKICTGSTLPAQSDIGDLFIKDDGTLSVWANDLSTNKGGWQTLVVRDGHGTISASAIDMGGPTITSGSSAPTNSAVQGSLYCLTMSAASGGKTYQPGLYVYTTSAGWLHVNAS